MLTLILTLVAAKQDATETQAHELQALIPTITQLRETRDPNLIADIHAQLQRIMGATWKPHGELAEAARNAHTIINNGITARGATPAQLFAPPK